MNFNELVYLNKHVKIIQDNPEYLEVEIDTPTISKFMDGLESVITKYSDEVKISTLLKKFKQACESVYMARPYTNFTDMESSLTINFDRKTNEISYNFEGKVDFYVDADHFDEDDLRDEDFSMAVEAFRGWSEYFGDRQNPINHIKDIVYSYSNDEEDNYFTFDLWD